MCSLNCQSGVLVAASPEVTSAQAIIKPTGLVSAVLELCQRSQSVVYQAAYPKEWFTDPPCDRVLDQTANAQGLMDSSDSAETVVQVSTGNIVKRYIFELDFGAVHQVCAINLHGQSDGAMAGHNDHVVRFATSNIAPASTNWAERFEPHDSKNPLIPHNLADCPNSGCSKAFSARSARYVRMEVMSSCSGCQNRDFFSHLTLTGCSGYNYTPITVQGCTSSTGCNFNAAATNDDGSCIEPDGLCETCAAERPAWNAPMVFPKFVAYGTVLANDADGDSVCDADEVEGCQSSPACNFNVAATSDDGSCIEPDGLCETCSGETDGTGTALANDSDGDAVCDADEVEGCQSSSACNFNVAATNDDGSCIEPDGLCETCSGETDGTGTVLANDSDGDGVCDTTAPTAAPTATPTAEPTAAPTAEPTAAPTAAMTKMEHEVAMQEKFADFRASLEKCKGNHGGAKSDVVNNVADITGSGDGNNVADITGSGDGNAEAGAGSAHCRDTKAKLDAIKLECETSGQVAVDSCAEFDTANAEYEQTMTAFNGPGDDSSATYNAACVAVNAAAFYFALVGV